MKRSLIATLGFLFVASCSVHLQAVPQATQEASGETLSAKEVRQMEKTAVTASDHERLAAYYQAQAQAAEKKLQEAQELLKKWGPVEEASKTPDPYPHARRMVWEYSADFQKYSRLAADHQWIAEKYEIAARAQKNGGTASDDNTNQSDAAAGNANVSAPQRNAFTLGSKGK